MLRCDWLVFNSCDWRVSILTVPVGCSLSGPLFCSSPIVFFDRGHPRFWNFNSTIPIHIGETGRPMQDRSSWLGVFEWTMLENEMLNVDAKTCSWKFLEPTFTLIQVVRFFGFILLLFLEFSSQDILQICRFMHGHMGSLCQLKKLCM